MNKLNVINKILQLSNVSSCFELFGCGNCPVELQCKDIMNNITYWNRAPCKKERKEIVKLFVKDVLLEENP